MVGGLDSGTRDKIDKPAGMQIKENEKGWKTCAERANSTSMQDESARITLLLPRVVVGARDGGLGLELKAPVSCTGTSRTPRLLGKPKIQTY